MTFVCCILETSNKEYFPGEAGFNVGRQYGVRVYLDCRELTDQRPDHHLVERPAILILATKGSEETILLDITGSLFDTITFQNLISRSNTVPSIILFIVNFSDWIMILFLQLT